MSQPRRNLASSKVADEQGGRFRMMLHPPAQRSVRVFAAKRRYSGDDHLGGLGARGGRT